MLVGTVAGIYDRHAEPICDELRRTGRAVADDDAVGTHGLESADGIEERFAFFQAGRFGLQVHGVGAQAGGGGGKAYAGAGGIFEKGEGDGFATQGGQFLEGMFLEFLERRSLVQNK